MKPMPEALSKRIEEMANRYELEKLYKNKSPQEFFQAGGHAMYQEMQAMLSERDAQLKVAQEENEQLKSLLAEQIKDKK